MVELIIEELNPDKPEITNYKHQITNKSQISITKSAGGGTPETLMLHFLTTWCQIKSPTGLAA